MPLLLLLPLLLPQPLQVQVREGQLRLTREALRLVMALGLQAQGLGLGLGLGQGHQGQGHGAVEEVVPAAQACYRGCCPPHITTLLPTVTLPTVTPAPLLPLLRDAMKQLLQCHQHPLHQQLQVLQLSPPLPLLLLLQRALITVAT